MGTKRSLASRFAASERPTGLVGPVERPPARRASSSPPAVARLSGSSRLWLLAGLLAAIYLVLFLIRLGGNIGAIDWVSDYSSGFTLAETIARVGDGGHTVISTTGAWVPLWFGLITAKLPLHRQLWEIMPTLLFIATALTISWSVAKIAGRREALLSALIVLVASPWALRIFMAAVAHNVVYPGTALLGAYLVWLAKGDPRRRLTTYAVPTLAAIALGVCIASDSLLIVAGVVPFAVAALIAVARRERRSRLAGASALATAIGAVPVAILTTAIMHSGGYHTLPPAFKLAPFAIISENARLLFDGLRELSNGYLGPSWPGTLHTAVGVACTIVLVAALLTLLFVGVRGTTRFIVSGLRRSERASSAELALGLHTVYWLASAVAVCAAFVFSTIADGTTHASYYVTVIFSIAAVLPLLLGKRTVTRSLVLAGACVFFLGSVVGLKRNYLQVTQPALAGYATQITKLAEANHVHTGYAGYWDASSLTWNSHERVIVRPLEECANPTGAPICPFFLMRTPAWYVPRPRHTFLLVDPGQLYVVTLPGGLGKPIASYTIGPIHMYIYPYDIASKLGPAPN